MTEGTGAKGAPRPFTEVELAAIGAYLPELRRSVAGQRILYTSLAIGFVAGLAAHVGGYLLRSSATTEPLGLLADLLYALGFALWTGVVVVVFVQILPETKRRQIMRGLDAYEAARRDKARAGSDQASRDDGAPTAS
jgi:zinc transporter ZupT